MMNSFDIIKNIFTKEEKLSENTINEFYDKVNINNILSHSKQNILLVNEMNKNLFNTPEYINYLFYYYIIDKKDRVPFFDLKKQKKEDKDLVQYSKYYLQNMSTKKINEVFDLIKNKVTELKKEDHVTGKKKVGDTKWKNSFFQLFQFF